jgi:hypothetical protein
MEAIRQEFTEVVLGIPARSTLLPVQLNVDSPAIILPLVLVLIAQTFSLFLELLMMSSLAHSSPACSDLDLNAMEIHGICPSSLW